MNLYDELVSILNGEACISLESFENFTRIYPLLSASLLLYDLVSSYNSFNVFDAFTTVDQDTALKSGELIAGGKVEGTLVFEETKGDTGLVLIYNDNMWSSKELKINLK